MPKLNEKGITQAVILLILLGGIIAGVWLITSGPLKLLPKADEGGQPISWPKQYCERFVNTRVCGQDTYDNCTPSCDGKKAIYNCNPTDSDGRKVCTGTILCEREDDRCKYNPCPTGTTTTTGPNGEEVCIPVPAPNVNTNTTNPYIPNTTPQSVENQNEQY